MSRISKRRSKNHIQNKENHKKGRRVYREGGGSSHISSKKIQPTKYAKLLIWKSEGGVTHSLSPPSKRASKSKRNGLKFERRFVAYDANLN